MPNISVGESFIFALYSGTEKVWIRRWEYQDFPSRKFCLTVPKTYVGESFTVALFFGSEKVWIRGGESRYSAENFLSHGDGKISVRESFVAFISGTGEVWRRRGVSIKIFLWKIFVSQSRKSP